MAFNTAAVALWTILSSRAATASGRCRPSAFGMYRRWLGSARYDFPVPRLPFSSVGQRVPGILDNGAGSFEPRTYPHFRHVLPLSPVFRLATQHGAFPLRPAFWVRPASPFDDDDPKPFALTSFKSTMPRSDSWHCIGRNFACAYIRTYRRRLQAGLCVLCLLALSSASVALFQPYLPFGQYQASLSH